MSLVGNRTDIVRNIRTLDNLSRSAIRNDRKYHHARIRKGHTLVWIMRDGRRIFAPSRYAGYKNNSPASHIRRGG
jgi:hypothetical protein